MGKKLANGVYDESGKFWPAGSTPPDEVAETITNPRAWDSDKAFDPEYVEQVVGAPTEEQIKAAEAAAAAQATAGVKVADESGDQAGDKPAKKAAAKAPAKKAAAKKAPAKRAPASS